MRFIVAILGIGIMGLGFCYAQQQRVATTKSSTTVYGLSDYLNDQLRLSPQQVKQVQSILKAYPVEHLSDAKAKERNQAIERVLTPQQREKFRKLGLHWEQKAITKHPQKKGVRKE